MLEVRRSRRGGRWIEGWGVEFDLGFDLIGREVEQRRLRVLGARLASGVGGVIVVTGASGVGKTALVGDFVSSLRSESDVVVSAVVGSEAERGWAYAGLDLVLSTSLQALPDTQTDARDAIEAFLAGLSETSETYEVARQAQALVAQVRQPLLIAVDDAHRLDAPSLDVLSFMARRLRSCCVALLLVAPQASVPAQINGLATIELAELPFDDAVMLAQRGAGRHALPSVAAKIVSRVGGNPRALLDVVARVPDPQLVGEVDLDRHLPWSPVLQELYLPELDDLDGPRRLALLVATGCEDGRIAPVVRALSDHEALMGWLLDTFLTASGASFTVRHTALRSVIWRAATHMERRAAHEALAAAYADDDDEQWMWHLAQSRHDTDDEIAGELHQVSARALARGECERALTFAREAARLTSSPTVRVDRLLLAGEFALRTGRLEETVQVARERFRLDTSIEQRADLALLEARARNLLDGDVATGMIARYIGEFGEKDPGRAAGLELFAAHGFVERMEPAEASRFLRSAEQRGPHLDEAAAARVRRTRARLAALNGELDDAAKLVDSDDVVPGDAYVEAERNIHHALVLTSVERFADAGRLLHDVTADARLCDSRTIQAAAWSARVMLEARTGRLGAALAAASAWERVGSGSRIQRIAVPATMIRVHALTGELDLAWAARQQCLDNARRHSDTWLTVRVQAETGALLLFLGRYDEAVSVLEVARRHALEFADPALLGVEPDLVEACVGAGDLERARRILAEFDVRARTVPTAWSQHAVARCHALVATGTESLALFEQASRTRTSDVSPVELTRTLLCHAERLRAAGRLAQASEVQRRAAVIAHECGAVALASRADGDPASGGVRPAQTLSGLTEAELRVATLAAAGKRNREIAEELYISVRTVETHLGRVFRKLGVRSRTELASVIIAGRDGERAVGA